MFGILLISFAMLCLATAFVTIALIYMLLAQEDYRWWWSSLLTGGSTGIIIYVYSFLFFFSRTAMSGVLQTTFFFGYMGLVSYAAFLMLGTVGYYASYYFIKYVYSSIKND